MDWYAEDFYDEPSEFDIAVEGFKAQLMKSVKGEFLKEMERLKNENEELQDVRNNFDQVQRDFEKKKRELEWEYQELKSKVRRERLSELMKDFEVEMYTIARRSHSKPKCDKCDENRKIHYTTPLGNETYEMCDCNEKISVYEVIPTLLNSLSIRNGESNVWYKVNKDRHDEWLSYYDDSLSKSYLVTDDSQFEQIWSYRALFKTKELAQKYCDFKNENKQSE